MKVRDYIETHDLYGEGENDIRLLYEDFLRGERAPSVRRYTDSMTLHLESKGQLLVARIKTKDVEYVNEFVRDVLKWGGKTGNRVRGQLYKNHNEQEIATAVGKAAGYLQADNLMSAITTITGLKGLSISYGSKILRMMSPENTAVYDSFMDENFSYSKKEDERCNSWVEFCNDCSKETDILRRKRIKNRFRIDGEWYAADVEAAIFRHIDRKKQVEKGKK